MSEVISGGVGDHLTWAWGRQAIRADLQNTLGVLSRMVKANHCDDWEYVALRAWWMTVDAFFRAHLHRESTVLAPALSAAGAAVPAAAVESSNHVGRLLHALKASMANAATREELQLAQHRVQALQRATLAHFAAGEGDLMTIAIATLSDAELEGLARRALKARGVQWWEVAHMYRRLGDDVSAKKAHARASLRVSPFPWGWGRLRRRLNRYDAEISVLIRELATPALRAYAESGGGGKGAAYAA